MSRVLNPEAQAERDEFNSWFGREGNCSCHLSPPCRSCLHPGNPRNQEEDEDFWTWETVADMLDELERDARAAVGATIEKAAARHLAEMGAKAGAA